MTRLLAFSFLSLLSGVSGCGPLRLRPYVGAPSSRGFLVTHWTPQKSRLLLEARRASDGRLEARVEEVIPSRHHVFSVQGLEPATRYTYAVRPMGSSACPPDRWRGETSTAPGPLAAKVSILVVGDSGPTGFFSCKPQFDVAASMEPADLLLHTGDIVYGEGGDPWTEFARAFLVPFADTLATTTVLPTIGNHDLTLDGARTYLEMFELPEQPAAERSYSFDYGPVHIVSLDSSRVGRLDDGILDWLERDLTGTELPWRIIISHYSPLKALESGQRADRRDLLQALTIARHHGAQLFLAGHRHTYVRYQPLRDEEDGQVITLVISGGGGATLESAAEADDRQERVDARHHHLRLGISGDELLLEAIDTDGGTFDKITIER